MAYEVTATRRRPQKFEDLAGQEFVVATLKNAIQTGQIAHAYLFSGPRGCGKTSSARILAKALNCERGPSAQPCGQCSACQEIARGASLDVIEIDGASNTSVNDVRQIKDEVLFPPNALRYKIYIIDEVHMLSTSAFNALLKTIEEPPPYVVFIFATTELHKVPATIKSRCQQFNFRLVAPETVKQLLAAAAAESGIQADDEALYWIARESTGSVRDAYTLFDQVAAFSGGHITYEKIRDKLGLAGVDRLNELCELCIDQNSAAALEKLDEILQNGVSIEQFIVNFADYLRSLLLIKSNVTKDSLLGQSASRFSQKVLAAWDSIRLERALSLFLQLFRDVRYSLSPRFELELALSRLTWLKEYVSPAEVKSAVDGTRSLLLGGAAQGGTRPLFDGGLNAQAQAAQTPNTPNIQNDFANAGGAPASADSLFAQMKRNLAESATTDFAAAPATMNAPAQMPPVSAQAQVAQPSAAVQAPQAFAQTPNAQQAQASVPQNVFAPPPPANEAGAAQASAFKADFADEEDAEGEYDSDAREMPALQGFNPAEYARPTPPPVPEAAPNASYSPQPRKLYEPPAALRDDADEAAPQALQTMPQAQNARPLQNVPQSAAQPSLPSGAVTAPAQPADAMQAPQAFAPQPNAQQAQDVPQMPQDFAQASAAQTQEAGAPMQGFNTQNDFVPQPSTMQAQDVPQTTQDFAQASANAQDFAQAFAAQTQAAGAQVQGFDTQNGFVPQPSAMHAQDFPQTTQDFPQASANVQASVAQTQAVGTPVQSFDTQNDFAPQPPAMQAQDVPQPAQDFAQASAAQTQAAGAAVQSFNTQNGFAPQPAAMHAQGVTQTTQDFLQASASAQISDTQTQAAGAPVQGFNTQNGFAPQPSAMHAQGVPQTAQDFAQDSANVQGFAQGLAPGQNGAGLSGEELREKAVEKICAEKPLVGSALLKALRWRFEGAKIVCVVGNPFTKNQIEAEAAYIAQQLSLLRGARADFSVETEDASSAESASAVPKEVDLLCHVFKGKVVQ